MSLRDIKISKKRFRVLSKNLNNDDVDLKIQINDIEMTL
jgi:hypothetical protein